MWCRLLRAGSCQTCSGAFVLFQGSPQMGVRPRITLGCGCDATQHNRTNKLLVSTKPCPVTLGVSPCAGGVIYASHTDINIGGCATILNNSAYDGGEKTQVRVCSILYVLRRFIATRGVDICSVGKAEKYLTGYIMTCLGCFVRAHQHTVIQGPVAIQQMGTQHVHGGLPTY